MDDDFKVDMAALRKFRAQTAWLPIILAVGMYGGFWFWGVNLTKGEQVVVSVVAVIGLILYQEIRQARADFLHHVILSKHGRPTRI